MRPRSVALLACLLLLGCAAERTLKITSKPKGATVRIDDRTVGETPFKFPFHHYGTRRITLEKQGYRTHSEQIELSPPWYARFPIDFFTEVVFPFGWEDKRRYHVELTAGEVELPEPSLRSVIERADALRFAGSDGPRDLPEPVPVEPPPIDTEKEEEEPEEEP